MLVDCLNKKKTKGLLYLLKDNDIVIYLPASEMILQNKFNSFFDLEFEEIRVKIYFYKLFTFNLNECREFKVIIDENIPKSFFLKSIILEQLNLKSINVEKIDSRTLIFKVKALDKEDKVYCKMLLICSDRHFISRKIGKEFDINTWVKLANVYLDVDDFNRFKSLVKSTIKDSFRMKRSMKLKSFDLF